MVFYFFHSLYKDYGYVNYLELKLLIYKPINMINTTNYVMIIVKNLEIGY